MSVLINGMEMPSEPVVVIISPNGKVFRVSCKKQIATAVPVPPHGDLIDRDALTFRRIRIAHPGGIIGGYNAVVMSAEINNAPTIIPAEEGET